MPDLITGNEAIQELLGYQNEKSFSYSGKGSLAKRLLSVNMNYRILRTNATLRYDEWKQIDRGVTDIARLRLNFVNALVSKGLTYNLSNGMGTTVIQSQNKSDISDADMTMDGISKSTKDRPDFQTTYLPIPITHKSFNFSARELTTGRNMGTPINTTTAIDSSRKVAEKIENSFLNGTSSFAFGGGTLYGVTDYPYRNEVTLSEQWDATACTGEDIIGMVIEMIDSAATARFHGPFILCIPSGYASYLIDDYKSNGDRTIYERIMAIPQISQIIYCDYLTAHNVVMIQATSDVIQVVVGMQPTTLEWETEGGLNIEFKVMAIVVPWIKSDQDGRCGIVHMS